VEFKAKVIAACQPGVSVASVALAHGLNANMLRGWLARERKALAGLERPSEEDGRHAVAAFVPVKLQERASPPADIRIELRRSATTISVTWPASAAAECAAWMRELLK
jgi:transposase